MRTYFGFSSPSVMSTRWFATTPENVCFVSSPFGQRTSNAPVRREPNWDSPRTRELAVRACFDCHSNQAQYPWYSHVAPMSWLVHHDIHEARLKMNFSEWDLPQREQWTTSGAAVAGPIAFQMAGVSPQDIDTAHLYDCFSIVPIITL